MILIYKSGCYIPPPAWWLQNCGGHSGTSLIRSSSSWKWRHAEQKQKQKQNTRAKKPKNQKTKKQKDSLYFLMCHCHYTIGYTQCPCVFSTYLRHLIVQGWQQSGKRCLGHPLTRCYACALYYTLAAELPRWQQLFSQSLVIQPLVSAMLSTLYHIFITIYVWITVGSTQEPRLSDLFLYHNTHMGQLVRPTWAIRKRIPDRLHDSLPSQDEYVKTTG